jgi:hypothetical protein
MTEGPAPVMARGLRFSKDRCQIGRGPSRSMTSVSR